MRYSIESDHLCILSGVRQGSVLWPLLFNVYVEFLINKLENYGLGCHFVNCCIGCIMSADGLLLIL